MTKRWVSIIELLGALILGFTVSLIFCAVIGESPSLVIQTFLGSVTNSAYDLGMWIYYMIPLALAGLAVAIPFQLGLFNIGGEGQLVVGTFTCAVVLLHWQGMPRELGWMAAFFAATISAGLWGTIAGWLKAWRGSHEVIVTIMLNFIAAALTQYLTLEFFRDLNSQSLQTAEVSSHYWIHSFSVFEQAPAGPMVFALLALLLLFGGLQKFHVWGFEMKVAGLNPTAARYAKIRVGRLQVLSMALGGACAGMIGLVEVLANSKKFIVGFSPGYGFMGIAVALLGRGRPFGILLSAALFSALHYGSTQLEFQSEKLTQEVSWVIQAFILLFATARRWRK